MGVGMNEGMNELRVVIVCDCRVLRDRKSTRLNSSHLVISYAVFCLKKKKYRNIPLSLSSRSSMSYATSLDFIPVPSTGHADYFTSCAAAACVHVRVTTNSPAVIIAG